MGGGSAAACGGRTRGGFAGAPRSSTHTSLNNCLESFPPMKTTRPPTSVAVCAARGGGGVPRTAGTCHTPEAGGTGGGARQGGGRKGWRGLRGARAVFLPPYTPSRLSYPQRTQVEDVEVVQPPAVAAVAAEYEEAPSPLGARVCVARRGWLAAASGLGPSQRRCPRGAAAAAAVSGGGLCALRGRHAAQNENVSSSGRSPSTQEPPKRKRRRELGAAQRVWQFRATGLLPLGTGTSDQSSTSARVGRRRRG